MDLIKNNKLFFVCDTIKEELKYAYKSSCKIQMLDSISNIIKICKGRCNTHFQWFARLSSNHIEGIITHAIYKVTNGKIEGNNQRIKTLRRKCYGLPKDLYFFLNLRLTRERLHKDILFPQYSDLSPIILKDLNNIDDTSYQERLFKDS